MDRKKLDKSTLQGHQQQEHRVHF